MSNQLQKTQTTAVKEKTQYGLTFGVIATMLFVAGFPMIVIFFFGVFAYFLWKTFSQPTQQGVRQVFEFYVSANEILRDDERRWFGFEVQEVIFRGEKILQYMHGAPPLVYFTLGALYNKIENHEAAVNHLSYVVENDNADEGTYLHPSNDLRDYVRVLRNIESEATKAPLTSAAVRSLERTRKNRGKIILEDSRRKLEEFKAVNGNTDHKKLSQKSQANGEQTETEKLFRSVVDTTAEKEERQSQNSKQSVRRKLTRRNKNNEEDLFANRKPITEVLHDIYDKNIQ
ncbi:MAG: hypothetical protein M3405_02530 [Acidobacteriota bacterium]|nr:hypothetical protein [Acidobacteriota bacterium]